MVSQLSLVIECVGCCYCCCCCLENGECRHHSNRRCVCRATFSTD